MEAVEAATQRERTALALDSRDAFISFTSSVRQTQSPNVACDEKCERLCDYSSRKPCVVCLGLDPRNLLRVCVSECLLLSDLIERQTFCTHRHE